MGKSTNYEKKYSKEWEKEEIIKGWICRAPGDIKWNKTNYLSQFSQNRWGGGKAGKCQWSAFFGDFTIGDVEIKYNFGQRTSPDFTIVSNLLGVIKPVNKRLGLTRRNLTYFLCQCFSCNFCPPATLKTPSRFLFRWNSWTAFYKKKITVIRHYNLWNFF